MALALRQSSAQWQVGRSGAAPSDGMAQTARAASLRDAPAFAALRAQHRALLINALDFAPGFDVSAPLSALQALQWQMRQSATVLRYHFVLQAATNVTRSVKALTSLQG